MFLTIYTFNKVEDNLWESNFVPKSEAEYSLEVVTVCEFRQQ